MKIDILQADDWMGLYINGRIVAENHRLSPNEVMEAIVAQQAIIESFGDDPEFIEYDHRWVEDDELEAWGWRFPETLS